MMSDEHAFSTSSSFVTRRSQPVTCIYFPPAIFYNGAYIIARNPPQPHKVDAIHQSEVLMATVNQMLMSKSSEVYSIPPDATVLDALRLMAEKDIGALLVMDGDELSGIFSERDYARKIALQGKSSRTTPIWSVMTDEVICVSPDQTADKCMAIMTDKHIRHLPVIDDGRVVGIISIGDVVKSIMTEQQVFIRHLEDYILS